MNALDMFAGLDWWSVAGWTMLHYLWLGLVVGAVAGVLRFALRRASAEVRYAAALVCLAALAVLPVGIGVGVAGVRSREPGARTLSGGGIVEASATPQAVVGAGRGEAVAPALGETVDLAPMVSDEVMATELASEPFAIVSPESSANPRQSRGLAGGISLSPYTEIAAGWLPWVWIVGAPVTFLLLCTGVVGAERLRRESRLVVAGPVVECLERLRTSLSIGRRVAVAVCERVAAPVLVGVVRPLILLPPAALSGWSPDEIEMVLLHELAHVRRWDNLVNLLQRFVEAVLFFQPAVWLVSGWVRREREACCDAVVVGATQRPQAYAELLVALAAQLPRSVLFHPAAASAMAAGPLRGRIRRILGIHDDPMLISGKSLGVVMSGLLLAATLVVLNLPGRSEAEQKTDLTTEDTESTEGKAAVSFDVGASRFDEGDKISISKVRGTKSAFEPGGTYWIEGTYTLGSRERASLSAFVTASSAGDGKTSIDKEQTMTVERGSGTFTLKLRMPYEGWPHVSFYPDGGGEGFGGVYFGTGDSVLTKWWDEKDRTTKGAEEKTEVKSPTAGLEESLGKKISFCVALFNAPGRGGELRELSKKFLDEGRTLYLYGYNVDPNSPAGKRFGLTGAPTCIVFQHGQETARLDMIQTREQLVQFVEAESPKKEPLASTAGDQDDDWLKNAVIVSPKEGEISRRAKELLGVRIVSASEDELRAARQKGFAAALKILDPIAKGQAGDAPIILVSLNGVVIEDYDVLDMMLAEISNRRMNEGLTQVKVGGVVGDREFVSTIKLPRLDSVEIHADKAGDSAAVAGGRDTNANAGDLGEYVAAGSSLPAASASGKFPTLEEQKLADVIWKRLNGLELEPLTAEQLTKVQELGYEGGLRNATRNPSGLELGDILVGLHVWPTKSLQDVVNVLNRDDLGELNPLKYYVIRPGQPRSGGGYGGGAPEADQVVTGRIEVNLDRQRSRPRTANRYSDEVPTTPRAATGKPALPMVDPQPATGYSVPTPASPPATAPAPQAATGLPVPSMPNALARRRELGSAAVVTRVTPEGLVLEEAPPDGFGPREPVLQSNLPAEPTASKPQLAGAAPQPALSHERPTPVEKSPWESWPSYNERLGLARQSALRYDGKSFDDWRTEWQTELSTAKRIEAVKALAAFGRAGYGKEAAAVILDVAGEYDFTFMQNDNDADGKLKQAVVEVLSPESGRPSLAEFWLPDLVGRTKDDPGKWRPLLAYAVGQLRSDNPQVIGLLRTLAEEGPAEVRGSALGAMVRSERVFKRTGELSEETRKLLAAALVSDDLDQRRSALWLLVYDPNNPWALGWNGMGDARLFYLPEFVGPLLGADEELRQRARLQLQYIQAKDVPALLEQLLKVLKDESRAAEHVEAIRAIAAMGPAGVAATEELKKIVLESKDEDAIIAALFASKAINNKNMATNLAQGSFNATTLADEILNSKARTLNLDQEPADELSKKLSGISRLSPRLEEEAEVLFPESRPRSGGGMF